MIFTFLEKWSLFLGLGHLHTKLSWSQGLVLRWTHSSKLVQSRWILGLIQDLSGWCALSYPLNVNVGTFKSCSYCQIPCYFAELENEVDMIESRARKWRKHWASGIKPWLNPGLPDNVCVHACSVTQSHLILCDPMDCSPPGCCVHRIFQARILEWAAIPLKYMSPQLSHFRKAQFELDFLSFDIKKILLLI